MTLCTNHGGEPLTDVQLHDAVHCTANAHAYCNACVRDMLLHARRVPCPSGGCVLDTQCAMAGNDASLRVALCMSMADAAQAATVAQLAAPHALTAHDRFLQAFDALAQRGEASFARILQWVHDNACATLVETALDATCPSCDALAAAPPASDDALESSELAHACGCCGAVYCAVCLVKCGAADAAAHVRDEHDACTAAQWRARRRELTIERVARVLSHTLRHPMLVCAAVCAAGVKLNARDISLVDLCVQQRVLPYAFVTSREYHAAVACMHSMTVPDHVTSTWLVTHMFSGVTNDAVTLLCVRSSNAHVCSDWLSLLLRLLIYTNVTIVARLLPLREWARLIAVALQLYVPECDADHAPELVAAVQRQSGRTTYERTCARLLLLCAARMDDMDTSRLDAAPVAKAQWDALQGACVMRDAGLFVVFCAEMHALSPDSAQCARRYVGDLPWTRCNATEVCLYLAHRGASDVRDTAPCVQALEMVRRECVMPHNTVRHALQALVDASMCVDWPMGGQAGLFHAGCDALVRLVCVHVLSAAPTDAHALGALLGTWLRTCATDDWPWMLALLGRADKHTAAVLLGVQSAYARHEDDASVSSLMCTLADNVPAQHTASLIDVARAWHTLAPEQFLHDRRSPGMAALLRVFARALQLDMLAHDVVRDMVHAYAPRFFEQSLRPLAFQHVIARALVLPALSVMRSPLGLPYVEGAVLHAALSQLNALLCSDVRTEPLVRCETLTCALEACLVLVGMTDVSACDAALLRNLWSLVVNLTTVNTRSWHISSCEWRDDALCVRREHETPEDAALRTLFDRALLLTHVLGSASSYAVQARIDAASVTPWLLPEQVGMLLHARLLTREHAADALSHVDALLHRHAERMTGAWCAYRLLVDSVRGAPSVERVFTALPLPAGDGAFDRFSLDAAWLAGAMCDARDAVERASRERVLAWPAPAWLDVVEAGSASTLTMRDGCNVYTHAALFVDAVVRAYQRVNAPSPPWVRERTAWMACGRTARPVSASVLPDWLTALERVVPVAVARTRFWSAPENGVYASLPPLLQCAGTPYAAELVNGMPVRSDAHASVESALALVSETDCEWTRATYDTLCVAADTAWRGTSTVARMAEMYDRVVSLARDARNWHAAAFLVHLLVRHHDVHQVSAVMTVYDTNGTFSACHAALHAPQLIVDHATTWQEATTRVGSIPRAVAVARLRFMRAAQSVTHDPATSAVLASCVAALVNYLDAVVDSSESEGSDEDRNDSMDQSASDASGNVLVRKRIYASE